MLSQLIAGQQAQAGQIAALQQQQHQMQQGLQPPQPQPPQQHAQQPGLAPVAAAAQPAGGVIGALPVPGHAAFPAGLAAPLLSAPVPAKSAGAKATAKRVADLWNSRAGPMYFMLRGGHDSRAGLDMDRLKMITRKEAHITQQGSDQICGLREIKIEHFFPPVSAGVAPSAMPADAHLSSFILVFTKAVQYGMDNAADICIERAQTWERGLEAVAKKLSSYLRNHFTLLLPHGTQAPNLLLEAINDGLNEGFHVLDKLAAELHRRHADGPPAHDTVDIVPTPVFKRLNILLDPDSANSLEERATNWSAPPAVAGTKRKAAAAPGKAAGSKQTAASRLPPVPAGFCKGFWHGSLPS